MMCGGGHWIWITQNPKCCQQGKYPGAPETSHFARIMCMLRGLGFGDLGLGLYRAIVRLYRDNG